jgi:hypothetical protein
LGGYHNNLIHLGNMGLPVPTVACPIRAKELEMPKEQEQDRPQPRTKQVASELDDRISYAVSNKGGVSIYGLRRFPFTFYKSELETVLGLSDELKLFMVENAEHLSDDKPDAGKNGKPEGGYTVNKADIALVAAEAAKLQEAGDIPGAIKYATIKSVAELGSKVTPEQMLDIMQLKVRK